MPSLECAGKENARKHPVVHMKSYIRSFRDRQTDSRAYSHTRISRSRMAELDYDCGSQVPLTAPSGPPVCV
ncbi:unnamed protein product [Arctogadus glacialis]